MVPSLTTNFLYISAFITIILPFIVAIIIWQKGDTKWWVFPAGMLGFIVTQMLIRVPLILWLSSEGWYTNFATHTIPFYLVTAFTAGLFETAGRVLVFLYILRLRHNYADGLLAGLGYGTIESILLVGSTIITYIVYATMINAGAFENLVVPNATDPASQDALRGVVTLLTDTPSFNFLASGIERFLTIILHIALSLLVLEGIERKQLWQYSLVAIGYHMLVDFVIPLVYTQTNNIWLSEFLLACFVILPIIYIFKARKRYAELGLTPTISE